MIEKHCGSRLALLCVAGGLLVMGAGDLSHRVRNLVQMPVAVHKVHRAGVDADMLRAMTGAMAGTSPSQFNGTLRAAAAGLRSAGPELNLRDFVLGKIKQGLRGRRLAEAIHGELRRHGIPAGGWEGEGPPPIARRFIPDFAERRVDRKGDDPGPPPGVAKNLPAPARRNHQQGVSDAEDRRRDRRERARERRQEARERQREAREEARERKREARERGRGSARTPDPDEKRQTAPSGAAERDSGGTETRRQDDTTSRRDPTDSPALTSPSTTGQTDTAARTDPDTLGRVGARIQQQPQRADRILRKAGMAGGSFTQALRNISRDPDASRAYTRSFQQALRSGSTEDSSGAKPSD